MSYLMDKANELVWVLRLLVLLFLSTLSSPPLIPRGAQETPMFPYVSYSVFKMLLIRVKLTVFEN